MCAVIMCHFTMESFEIIEKSKRSIVPEATRFIKNSLFKDNKCVTVKNQPSYCKQDCLRDCGCHGCGGYNCLQHRRFMRTKRSAKGISIC